MPGLADRLRSVLSPPPLVAVLRLHGAIGGGPIGRSLSDAALAPIIERAFAPKRLAAVALSINSPGGSPTQSALIAARIRRLAAEKNVRVFAFCEDLAASGGYWLACAADEIYADANAVVGSIGVIAAGFGLQDAIARIGVERRVRTAGARKALLDPFRPEDPDDAARLERILGGVHENFKRHVAETRGDRLTGDPAELFSGDVWLAGEARERGLIDGIGHLAPVMKARFGDRTRFRVAEPKKTLLRRLGAPGAADLVAAVEVRALWARYGL